MHDCSRYSKSGPGTLPAGPFPSSDMAFSARQMYVNSYNIWTGTSVKETCQRDHVRGSHANKDWYFIASFLKSNSLSVFANAICSAYAELCGYFRLLRRPPTVFALLLLGWLAIVLFASPKWSGSYSLLVYWVSAYICGPPLWHPPSFLFDRIFGFDRAGSDLMAMFLRPICWRRRFWSSRRSLLLFCSWHKISSLYIPSWIKRRLRSSTVLRGYLMGWSRLVQLSRILFKPNRSWILRLREMTNLSASAMWPDCKIAWLLA